MYGGLDTPYGSNNMKIAKDDPWMSESLENHRGSSGSEACSFSINWDGSKWISIVNITLWHDRRLKHCHPPFLRIVFCHIFWQLWVNLLSFKKKKKKTVVRIQIQIISRVARAFLKILCVYACANCMQNARFPLMHTIDAKLCYHLMFQNSFQNIERQNIYCKFLDDRLELWPSIHIHMYDCDRFAYWYNALTTLRFFLRV